MTLERLASDCSLQVAKPACAAATARSTSALLAKATRRTTAPVAGSVTSPNREASDTRSPPIQWATVSRAVVVMSLSMHPP